MSRCHRILVGGVAALALLWPAGAAASTQPIVRFSTSLGTIDVQLLPQQAPKTVANFLSYVDGGAYAHTFFHRTYNVTGLNIIQGGGFSATTNADGSASVQAIPTQPPVPSEAYYSNTRGTLAMALPSGSSGANPDGGTDQWFFNVGDDSSQLDPQRFTVFGIVLDPSSLSVVDAIDALPATDASASPGFPYYANSPFTQVPVRNFSSGNPVMFANLVTSPITRLVDDTPPSITISQPAGGASYSEGQTIVPRYSCDDGDGTGVESCSATAPPSTSQPGPQSFSVTATDYAGNTQTQTVSYTVAAPAGSSGGGTPPAEGSGSEATATTPAPSSPGQQATPPEPLAKPKPQPTGATPSAAPRLGVPLRAVRGGAVPLKLHCASQAVCKGRALLYLVSGSRKHPKLTLAGSVVYSVPAGAIATVAISLRSIPRSARGTVPVSVSLTAPGRSAHATRTTLKLPS